MDLIPEQVAQLEILEEVKGMVLRGESISVFIIGEITDGRTYYCKGTQCENKYAMVGFAISLLSERAINGKVL